MKHSNLQSSLDFFSMLYLVGFVSVLSWFSASWNSSNLFWVSNLICFGCFFNIVWPPRILNFMIRLLHFWMLLVGHFILYSGVISVIICRTFFCLLFLVVFWYHSELHFVLFSPFSLIEKSYFRCINVFISCIQVVWEIGWLIVRYVYFFLFFIVIYTRLFANFLLVLVRLA